MVSIIGRDAAKITFPEDEFEKNTFGRVVLHRRATFGAQFYRFTEMQRRLNAYDEDDPRYTMTPDEEIAAIKSLKLEER